MIRPAQGRVDAPEEVEVRRAEPLASIAAVLLLCGCAASGSSDPASGQVGAAPKLSATLEETAVKTTAVVKAIDLERRKVELEGTDGRAFTVTAGPEVRNLDRVEVGDQVVATYYESIAYEVREPGSGAPGMSVEQDLLRGKPGTRPSAAGARETTLRATIEAIDKPNGMVTLAPASGESFTVKARDPANLDKVDVGDLVEITVREAFAISVEPKQP
jgi:hypothetical protein